MGQKSKSRNDPAERTVRDIRRKTRKQYSAEEKIRIVVSGLRGVDRQMVQIGHGAAGIERAPSFRRHDALPPARPGRRTVVAALVMVRPIVGHKKS